MRIRTRNERVALWAAACLVLAEGSSSNEVKKAEAPAAVKSEPAPNVSKVSLDTAKGPVILEVHRDWAPWGADHFYNLIKTGFYDGDRFFGVVRNFVVQFGINGDPKINRLWANANLRDDPVKQSNAKRHPHLCHLRAAEHAIHAVVHPISATTGHWPARALRPSGK